MPATKTEMAEFSSAAVKNTRTLLELNIPIVTAFLPSKNFFEMLYNRLLNDLVLWEPAAPTPIDAPVPYGLSMGMYPLAGWSPEFVPMMTQFDPEKFLFCNNYGQQTGMVII